MSENDETEPLVDTELLLEIVRAFVDSPEQVRIEEKTISHGTRVLVIHTAPADLGKVIGKKGSTVGAIRNLFGRIGANERRRIVIEVANALPGTRQQAA